MLLLLVSLAARLPASDDAPAPADFVFAPPEGTKLVAPPRDWCPQSFIDAGGACVEGTIAGVQARITLEIHPANEGPAKSDWPSPPCFDLANSWGFAAVYADDGLCAVDTACEPESADKRINDCSAPFHGKRIWYRSFENRGVLLDVDLDDAPAETWQKALALVRKAILGIHARDRFRYRTRELTVHLSPQAVVDSSLSSIQRVTDGAYSLTWGPVQQMTRAIVGDSWLRSVQTSSGTILLVVCGGGPAEKTTARKGADCVRLLEGVEPR